MMMMKVFFYFCLKHLVRSRADDNYDNVFIKLSSLPNRGVLCGYNNKSPTAIASPSSIIYLIYK